MHQSDNKEIEVRHRKHHVSFMWKEDRVGRKGGIVHE